MATALRIFGEAVAAVAGDDRAVLQARRRRRTRSRPSRRRGPEDRRMTSKVASMRDAVAELVRDGDTVAIEGFTHSSGSRPVTRSSASDGAT